MQQRRPHCYLCRKPLTPEEQALGLYQAHGLLFRLCTPCAGSRDWVRVLPHRDQPAKVIKQLLEEANANDE